MPNKVRQLLESHFKTSTTTRAMSTKTTMTTRMTTTMTTTTTIATTATSTSTTANSTYIEHPQSMQEMNVGQLLQTQFKT